MDIPLLIIVFGVWLSLVWILAKHLNRELISENHRLRTENKIFSTRAIQAGLEISALEKDKHDLAEALFNSEEKRKELLEKWDVKKSDFYPIENHIKMIPTNAVDYEEVTE